ncbi:MAG TPA: TRIC cation channel family protein [Sphingobium sp.]|uniref:trimeric intracellular cation channel family protein n=1 Tax=Sphingobium sp. TaxID=1912891 RepID=UPI002ED3E31B
MGTGGAGFLHLGCPVKRSPGIAVVRIADRSGTLVNAMEGALAGILAGFDPVGVLVIAFVSALGGGVIRDLVLGVRPAAVDGWPYSTLVLIGVLVSWFFFPFVAAAPTLLVMLVTAVGLSLFAVAGTEKALDNGIHALPAIFLGTVGAVGGGVVRDVLLNVAPRILHADVYASAAMLGATIVVIGRRLQWDARLSALAGGLACFALRVTAYSYDWNLPHLVTVKG